jgi:hypothetical protein
MPRVRRSRCRGFGVHDAVNFAQAGHAEVGPPPLENGGKVVRGSAKAMTDGPYAEAKDLVSGILVVSASSLAAAVELARGCPIYEYDGSVEVRPLQDMHPGR